MISRYLLADSLWPRSGGDARNRSRVEVPGPERATTRWRLPLPRPRVSPSHPGARGAGIVVASDGRLRVAYRAFLYCVTLDGELVWTRRLRETPRRDLEYHSAPIALRGGALAVALERSVLVVDAVGATSRQVCDRGLDDSGPSPNVTSRGELILTASLGDTFLLRGGTQRELGCHGYDLVPPARFNDDSLAISGYASKGFCRVGRDGREHWRTTLRDADMVAVINDREHSAVGSLNDDCSVIFDARGRELGRYGRAAVCAEYPQGEWIALGRRHLARLGPRGELRWERRLRGELTLGWGSLQPIVDGRGRIYFPQPSGLGCRNGDGKPRFHLPLRAQPLALAMVAPGALALIADHELVLVG